MLQYLHLQLLLLYSMDLSHLHQWHAGLLLVLGINTLVCLEKTFKINFHNNKGGKQINSSCMNIFGFNRQTSLEHIKTAPFI